MGLAHVGIERSLTIAGETYLPRNELEDQLHDKTLNCCDIVVGVGLFS